MAKNYQKNILLSDYTTIGLGGKAKYFISCKSNDDIIDSLKFALENNLNVQVLSGGSNIIFPDDGYDGVVLKIDSKGIEFNEIGNFIYAKVNAGEDWDGFVKLCIENNLTGIECLSGIPGSVGATPIQNVGAYGQEVSETIFSVEAIERSSLKSISFNNSDCNFDYRESRFKNIDKDKFIITKVTFRFEKNIEPEIKYQELKKFIDLNSENFTGQNQRDKLNKIRISVLTLRKTKSMLIDNSDPNSKSCGSFFLNPLLNEEEFNKFKHRVGKKFSGVPVFEFKDYHKISAAWLVENAGFNKGYVKGEVGISKNHALALINRSGDTKELLELAADIENEIYKKFGIKLIKEPEIV